jgi:hypothetical protein
VYGLIELIAYYYQEDIRSEANLEGMEKLSMLRVE